MAHPIGGDCSESADRSHDLTLLQVIGKVLTRRMTTTEIVVAVLEAGYQTTMGKTNLRNHVTQLLRRGGFKQDAGKWLA
jgi:hypothetical protein